jgi:hypothetical protein
VCTHQKLKATFETDHDDGSRDLFFPQHENILSVYTFLFLTIRIVTNTLCLHQHHEQLEHLSALLIWNQWELTP